MIDIQRIDWAKVDGLVPAIVQHASSGEVLMLGYMNQAAVEATLETRLVTFFSRSRGRLWAKGESSGNALDLHDMHLDCDNDALLVRARPRGPTCHTGTRSCFGDEPGVPAFLSRLEEIVADRADSDAASSYTARLLQAGVKRIAQKVGEEAVEVALAAAAGDVEELAQEAADLLYHLTVLLRASGSSWDQVMGELRRRHALSSEPASL